ncbi:MAG: protein kinase [Gemmataceae bacterium]|nr:protein kinase [Gemmataceae bacterium]
MTATDSTEILDRFERAWRESPAPDLSRFLPEGPGREQALIDLVHIDMEMRAKSGQPFEVELYLERFPELASATADLAVWEFRLRSKGGAAPRLREYARRFPALAGQLEARIGADPTRLPGLPGYEIADAVGKGGMGLVYKARHVSLERLVAIKVIRSDLAAHPQARRRFEAEGKAAARLDHPGIVRVFDSGVHEGQPYLVMEWVDGGSLAGFAGRPVPARLAAGIVAFLAEAVHHAHERGVIHRDLKPANVLLHFRDGAERTLASARIKVADFGLARLAEASGDTRTGEFLGTVLYAAPEQAAGDVARIGPATDVWSLGVILHELATGRPPFQGSAAQVLAQVLAGSVPPAGVDAEFDGLCRRAMAKEPKERFGSAREMSLALKAYLRTAPVEAEKAMPALLAPPDASKVSTVPPLMETAPFAPPPRKPVRARHILAGVLAALLVLGGVVLWFRTPTDVRVSVDLPVDCKDARLTFVLDGRELPRDEAEGPIRLKPGKHALIVRRDGKPWKEYEVVVEGRKATVEDKTPAEKPERVTERQMAEWVLEQGGLIHLDEGGRAGHPITKKEGLPPDPKVRLLLFANCEKLEDEGLRKHLLAGSRLVNVSLVNCPLVTDAGVVVLRDLPKLDTVVLQNCKRLTDEAVRTLPMDRLARLSLQGSGFTSASVKELGRAKRLESVGFIGLRLGDDDFKAWAGMDSLTAFSVIQHPAPADFTGAALAHLSKSRRMNYIDLSSTGVTDENLKHLSAFPALADLRLARTPLTGKGFGTLAKLPSLTELHLGFNVLDDEGMKHLAGCPLLTTLNLEKATVSETGFAALGKSRSLSWLSVVHTSFGDKAAAGLAECGTLARLDAIGTQLGDEGGTALAKCKSLWNLTANESKLTDKGVIALTGSESLHTLNVWRMRLTDESAKALAAKAPRLRVLGMAATGITDVGLKALEGKKGWEALNIQGTRVTAAGVEAFRKSHPMVRVESDPKE